MPARVFISYRSSDGTDKATALARDLDELFGEDQIFLDKEDLPAGSRWRDEIASTLHSSPILLVLVTPHYLDARTASGTRCIERADDPVRGELEVAVAAGARIIPLMCDGVASTPSGDDLPEPFDQLAERTWRRLRAYDWREDLGRLAEDLRGLGVTPRIAANAVAEPITVPMPAGHVPPEVVAAFTTAATAPTAPATGRRSALLAASLLLLGAGGYAAWRWRERRSASLVGRWRVSVGRRGATSSEDGEVVMVAIEQSGQSLRIASSAVDIARDPDWQNYRDYWKKRTGTDLVRVFYRGDGGIRGEGDDGNSADAPPGPRRILVSVRVDVPGGSEAIDTGALRGAIDPDGQRIRGRLWLNSEQGERVVDLRREP